MLVDVETEPSIVPTCNPLILVRLPIRRKPWLVRFRDIDVRFPDGRSIAVSITVFTAGGIDLHAVDGLRETPRLAE
jgi:hypothetical protein